MANKIEKREVRRKDLHGLDDRQKHIIELREKLNKPDTHQVKAFTSYKIITYIFNVIFPPYALYRIWCQKSEFSKIERYTQSFVATAILCLFILLQLERYQII